MHIPPKPRRCPRALVGGGAGSRRRDPGVAPVPAGPQLEDADAEARLSRAPAARDRH